MQVDANSDPNFRGFLQQILQVAASESGAGSVTPSYLESARQVLGASGACVCVQGSANALIQVGEGWLEDSEQVLSWAATLSNSVASSPPLPSGVSVTAKAWFVVKQPQNGVVCFWFNEDSPDVDSQQVQDVANVLYLAYLSDRAGRRQRRATLLANSILSSIIDPLIVLDENRRLLMMNPAAENLFKVETATALGKPLRDVLNADDLMAIIESQDHGDRDTVREWSSADQQTFLPRMSIVHTPDGVPDGWVLALRDVSQFKRLNRNQNEFMRVVSHDLRSPLTSIQGFADMIKMRMVGDVTEKQEYFIDKILAGIVQMTGIVDNIQDAGRFDPETGFYDMSRGQVDLGELVDRVVSQQIIPAEKQELTLTVSVADNVPIINADGNMLERAVINLVDNAIKYTPNGGQVHVDVQRKDEHVIIGVSDDGLGISEEDQKRLFKRHVRLARKEHKKVKGTGLGLFIVQSVAQHHGGQATVKSTIGEGTTFSIEIPLNHTNLVD